MSVANIAMAAADIEIESVANLINNGMVMTTEIAAASLDAASRIAMPHVASECIAAASSPPSTLAISGSPPAAAGLSIAASAPCDGGIIGLSLMQSSPPPHSYRHSRAYRHFKNPPQPHMCIRTTTDVGEELFINVLSWTRIVIPQEPSDPIPLYGGMRVPPGSPRSPPIVFAVMANPEVLKDSGRHSKDPEERRAMVELMCDFVEAMNPGVKLVRNAVILKDRDISGELKDVWNAVQAQRDREREEQIMQQRQQQHYHNITTQQMFPKSTDVARSSPQQHEEDTKNVVTENTTTGHETTAASDTMSSPTVQQFDNRTATEQQNSNPAGNNIDRMQAPASATNSASGGEQTVSDLNVGKEIALTQQNGNESNDQIDATNSKASATIPVIKHEIAKSNINSNVHSSSCSTQAPHKQKAIDSSVQNVNKKCVTKPTSPTSPPNVTTVAATTNANANLTAATPTTTAPPSKKDKLAGFLPNGCIFPRFKNNKHKDKDKEKESKSKDKEKTLLNALKKSKEKKVAPIDQVEKCPTEADAKTQYEKNCINLENEVQKLDLNKLDATNSNDPSSMFIKLKVAATSAAAK